MWYVPGLENQAADACSGHTSRQLIEIENATRTRPFVVPLVENWVSPEGEPVDEFLHVLKDSFLHDEVWPQPYNHLYVSLRRGRSVGKDPDVDVDAEPALEFDMEPAVEPDDLEPLPTDEVSAEDSHQPAARLNDTCNEMPGQSTDRDEVDLDHPFQVTFGKELCPDADGVDPLSTPPRGYTAANILIQGWPEYAVPLEP